MPIVLNNPVKRNRQDLCRGDRGWQRTGASRPILRLLYTLFQCSLTARTKWGGAPLC